MNSVHSRYSGLLQGEDVAKGGYWMLNCFGVAHAVAASRLHKSICLPVHVLVFMSKWPLPSSLMLLRSPPLVATY